MDKYFWFYKTCGFFYASCCFSAFLIFNFNVFDIIDLCHNRPLIIVFYWFNIVSASIIITSNNTNKFINMIFNIYMLFFLLGFYFYELYYSIFGQYKFINNGVFFFSNMNMVMYCGTIFFGVIIFLFIDPLVSYWKNKKNRKDANNTTDIEMKNIESS